GSARPPAATPPSSVSTRPKRSQPASASPSGSTAARKRCTRPRKLVNVPSRSTHAASGSTSGARVPVPFSLVPVKISVSRRSSASPVAAVGHALPGRSCWITHSTLSAPARAGVRMPSASAAHPPAAGVVRALAIDVHVHVAAARAAGTHRLGGVEVPDAHLETELAVGQRAHRADVHHVAGIVVLEVLAGEEADLRVIAAAEDAELARARDLVAEPHAARAE